MSIESGGRARLCLAGLIVLATFAIPAHHASSVSMAGVAAIEPAQAILARAGRSLALSLDSLAGLWNAAAENRKLRAEVARLREEADAERARSAQKDERLAALGELAAFARELARQPAEVIGQGAGPDAGVVFIDRGASSLVGKGSVVVAGRSVVGRVRAASASASSVLLVTAAGSAFDAVVLSSGERGILAGNGDGTMSLRYISRAEPRPGDPVLTRARDGQVPGNLLLGRVARVERAPGSLTYSVTVHPLRDLDRLEFVDVVRPQGAAEASAGGRP